MSAHHSVSLHVPKAALWLLGTLLVAPWLAFGGWLFLTHRPSIASTIRTETPAQSVPVDNATAAAPISDLVTGRPGPWGKLEYFSIFIEPPEEFILSDYTEPHALSWLFKGYSEAALATLWQAAGLTSAQQAFVNDPAHREVRTGAIVLHPDATFITGLSQAARTAIYAALAQFPENFAQANPFRIRASTADAWLDGTDLPPDAIALAKQLFYPRGVTMCFSDQDVVLPTIPTAAQRTRFVKALSRKSARVVLLRVDAGEDVEPLVEYWARGGRSKDLKPLLQSLARRPGGGAIDIVHLLPRFPRMLAYTYPLPSERPIDANHDCHWTSFNFQNEVPDERFSNIEYVRQVLFDQYYPVPGAPQLGDIIMFVQPNGEVVHSCVYIADDIVFTKNGPAYSVPWLLAPLADVKAFYATMPGIEVRRYRAKNL